MRVVIARAADVVVLHEQHARNSEVAEDLTVGVEQRRARLPLDTNFAAPIFSWLCVGGLTSAMYASTFWLLISQDRAKELRLFTAIAAVINVSSYLIGSHWGVIGIARAASIGFVFISTPLLLYAATRTGPVRSKDIATCAFPFVVQASLVYMRRD